MVYLMVYHHFIIQHGDVCVLYAPFPDKLMFDRLQQQKDVLVPNIDPYPET
jgi:hypothetical protein